MSEKFGDPHAINHAPEGSGTDGAWRAQDFFINTLSNQARLRGRCIKRARDALIH
jgi:hypothetical protein